MHSDEFLQAYLKICHRTFEKQIRDGTCLWDTREDSPNPENLIESEDNQQTE